MLCLEANKFNLSFLNLALTSIVTFDVQFGEPLQQFLRRGQPYSRVFLLLGVRHGTRFKKQSKIKLLERKLQVLKNLKMGSAEHFNAVYNVAIYDDFSSSMGFETDSTFQLICDDFSSSMGFETDTTFKLLTSGMGKHGDEACEKVVVTIPLEYYEYPDTALFQEVVAGFPLTGWLPDSQVFSKDLRPPCTSTSTLKLVSKGIDERVKAKVMATAASDLTEATWPEMEMELQEGWMEFDNGNGKDDAWALRFDLQQKNKVRVIKDFSIAGVNHTAGLLERPKIFGIDEIAALVAYSLDSCDQADHPALLGKTMDLKGAYKQFGVRLEDREKCGL